MQESEICVLLSRSLSLSRERERERERERVVVSVAGDVGPVNAPTISSTVGVEQVSRVQLCGECRQPRRQPWCVCACVCYQPWCVCACVCYKILAVVITFHLCVRVWKTLNPVASRVLQDAKEREPPLEDTED